MPFDGQNDKLTNLEALCSTLENTKTFRISVYHWSRGSEHPCGTPACVVGHAYHIWPDLDPVKLGDNSRLWVTQENSVRDIAERIGVEWRPFFLLTHCWETLGIVKSEDITGRMAAAALRRLYHTGEARYDLADA